MNSNFSTVLLSETDNNHPDSRQSPYQLETLRPIVSLIFVIPIIFVYELSCIAIAPTQVRTGIDQWLHQIMGNLGLEQFILLPFLAAGVLLWQHHNQADNWRMKPIAFVGMLTESFGLGLILFFAASAYYFLNINVESLVAEEAAVGSAPDGWTKTVGFLGAGIYEELLFRLLLLTGLVYLLKTYIKLPNPFILAAIVTSFLFAISHYEIVNPAGVAFESHTFLFRFLASLFFCVIFQFRGFGIVVGAHVVYDIFSQL